MTVPSDAYLAGLFDGEGCIGVYPQRDNRDGGMRYALQMNIANTNLPALQSIREHYGGEIILMNPVGSGHDRNRNYAKPAYRLRFSYAEAEQIIGRIRPLCLIKARELEFAQWYLLTSKLGKYWRGPRGTRMPSGIRMIRDGIVSAIRSEKHRPYEAEMAGRWAIK